MAQSMTILVVDDDPDIAPILERAAASVFEQAHFVPVYSYEQAVSYLDGLHGRGPRLVLLDINLQSQRDGLDVLARLRAHPQGRLVPTVMLSGTYSPALAQEAYRRGANAFTKKPFSFQDWKDYILLLKAFWFNVATLPNLRFEGDNEQSEP